MSVKRGNKLILRCDVIAPDGICGEANSVVKVTGRNNGWLRVRSLTTGRTFSARNNRDWFLWCNDKPCLAFGGVLTGADAWMLAKGQDVFLAIVYDTLALEMEQKAGVAAAAKVAEAAGGDTKMTQVVEENLRLKKENDLLKRRAQLAATSSWKNSLENAMESNKRLYIENQRLNMEIRIMKDETGYVESDFNHASFTLSGIVNKDDF